MAESNFPQGERLKALTVCQPYAHLIADGTKRVENREWPTRYRGLLYIHAGKSRDWLTDDNYGIPVERMVFGAIVAIATLADCIHIDKVGKGMAGQRWPWLADHEHTEGTWCWVLGNAHPVGPWPWRGAQGLWEMDSLELEKVANRELGIVS